MPRKFITICFAALAIVGCANQACDDESYGELSASFAELAALIETAEETPQSELPTAISNIEALQQDIQALDVASCADPAKEALDELIEAVVANFNHYYENTEIDEDLSEDVADKLESFQSEMADLAEQVR